MAGFEAAGVAHGMVVAQPHCRPEAYLDWLAELGLEVRGGWDRVVRDGGPLVAAAACGDRPSKIIPTSRHRAEKE